MFQRRISASIAALALSALVLAPQSRVAQEAAGRADARASVGQRPAVDWGEDFQVRVFGGEPTQRVFFTSFSREIQDNFRNVLLRRRPGEESRRLDWIIPIRIDLWGRSNEVYKGPDLVTSVEIGPDDRFLIRISVKIHDRFEEDAYRLELAKALLVEQMVAPYAANPSAFRRTSISAPDWLAHGFDELLQHRNDGQPSAFFRGILESGQMLSPEELIETTVSESMDPVSRAAFRASSAAFVEALLNQPGGESGVRAFLADLGGRDGANPLPLLRQHFPAFREINQGMDKWWALEMATMGAQQGFEYMSREETEKWLTDALTLKLKSPQAEAERKSAPGFFQRFKRKKEVDVAVPEVQESEEISKEFGIEAYRDFKDIPGAEGELKACFQRLQRVKQVGFPLYRPVFARYEVILQRLIAGKLKEIDTEIEEAEKMREKINDTLVKSEDFLNYFEATRMPTRSRAFDDYLKMRRILQEDLMPKRDDRISRFLDQVEQQQP